jgi:hypothetical protein
MFERYGRRQRSRIPSSSSSDGGYEREVLTSQTTAYMHCPCIRPECGKKEGYAQGEDIDPDPGQEASLMLPGVQHSEPSAGGADTSSATRANLALLDLSKELLDPPLRPTQDGYDDHLPHHVSRVLDVQRTYTM